MKTKAEYIAQCKADNPPPLHATINGVTQQLTDEEYEDAVEKWAEMRVYQDEWEREQAAGGT